MAEIRTQEEAVIVAEALRDDRVPESQRGELEAALREYAARPQEPEAEPAAGETNPSLDFPIDELLDVSPLPGRPAAINPNDRVPGGFGMSPNAIRRLSGQEELGTAENPDRQFFLNAAAQSGVDIHTGAGLSDRGRAALLAFDTDAQMAALDFSVRTRIEESGIEIPETFPVIFRDVTSGEAVYLRPTEDGRLRATLINPMGADAADFLELGAEIPTIALETGGAVVGGIAGTAVKPGTGTVMGASGGAAAGSALSMELRKGIASFFGVPEDIVENTDISLTDIAFAAGSELGVGALMGAIRKFRNVGRPLTEEDLPRILEQYEENLRILEDLQNRLGGDIDLTPTIGELTGDATLLVAEADLRKLARGPSATDASARDVQLRQNTGVALRELADVNGIRTADDLAPVEDVSEGVRDATRTAVDDAMVQEQAIRNQVDEVSDTIDDMPDLQAFEDVRDGTVLAIREAELQATRAWQSLRQHIGWDPETGRSALGLSNPEGSPIRTAFQQIDASGQNALLQSLQNAQEGVVQDAAELITSNTLDFNQLHQALSHYKRRMRQADRGLDPDGFRAEDLRRIVTAIEEQVQNLPIIRTNGQIVSEEMGARTRLLFDDANEATRRTYDQYDTQNIRLLVQQNTVLDPDTGRYVLQANTPGGVIRRQMFVPDDARFLSEALEAIGNEPLSRAALAEELMKVYRDRVFEGGIPRVAKHNEFMASYQDHMNLLLGPERAAQVTSLGSFSRALDDFSNDIRRLENDIQSAYGRRVTDPAQPLNIADEILSDRVTPRQARNVMNRLNNFDPALADQVRSHVIDRIFHQSVSKTDVINSRTMGQLIRDNRSTLQVMFGSQYVRDLDSLHSVMRMIDNRQLASGTPQEVQTWWLQMTRSLMGPLSRKQRFLTAANRVNRRLAGAKAADLMQDPSNLRAFIRLSEMTPSDPRFMFLVGQLGLHGFIDEQTLSVAENARQTRFEIGREFGEISEALQGGGNF